MTLSEMLAAVRQAWAVVARAMANTKASFVIGLSWPGIVRTVAVGNVNSGIGY